MITQSTHGVNAKGQHFKFGILGNKLSVFLPKAMRRSMFVNLLSTSKPTNIPEAH